MHGSKQQFQHWLVQSSTSCICKVLPQSIHRWVTVNNDGTRIQLSDDPSAEVVAIASPLPGLNNAMRMQRVVARFFKASDDWDGSVSRIAILEALIDLNRTESQFDTMVRFIIAGLEENNIAPESVASYPDRRRDSLQRTTVTPANRPIPANHVPRPNNFRDFRPGPGPAAPTVDANRTASNASARAGTPVMSAFRRQRADPGSANPAERSRPRREGDGEDVTGGAGASAAAGAAPNDVSMTG